jgi:hypothetical protein
LDEAASPREGSTGLGRSRGFVQTGFPIGFAMRKPLSIGPTHGFQPGAEAGRQALEGREMVLSSVAEKWRKLALFFECPKRHFSALQTPRQIGIL